LQKTTETLFVKTVSVVLPFTFAPASMNRETRSHLLRNSRQLFIKYGVKSLTMDDIARELGMSKKTIYQFVSAKNELVVQAMEAHLEVEKVHIAGILERAPNSVQGMLGILEYMISELRQLNPSVIYDLQKYYPDAWAVLNNYRYQFVLGMITRNLEKGKEEGVYRQDLNTLIIGRVYVKALDVLLDQQTFPISQFNFIDIYSEFIRYHLRGIVSAEGLSHLDQLNP